MKMKLTKLQSNNQSKVITEPDIKGIDFFDGKPDGQIWKSFKNGNEAAFNYIYKQYFYELFAYGARFTDKKETIKDAIQDIFIEMRNSASRLSDTDSIKFYLFKALRYKILFLLKKESKFKLIQDFSHGFYFDIELSYESRLIQQYISEENKQKLEKAFNALSNREREAMYYFYYQGMTYEEVAEVMELKSAKQVRNLIYKCLKVLRNEFQLVSLTLLLIILSLTLIGK